MQPLNVINAGNHPKQLNGQKDTEDVHNVELSLQILYLTGRILVVCTGPCGESYSFIEKSKVTDLINKSLQIHNHIDVLIELDAKGAIIEVEQRNTLERDLKKLGNLLFISIFKKEILDILNMTLGRAIRLNLNVLIKIMIADHFLNIIPWELLYDGKTYLSLSYDIIRHPFGDQPIRSSSTHKKNIRILFIGANPRNNIQISNQIQCVTNTLEADNVIFNSLITPDANYKNIASEIYDGIDILHFLAHGEYSSGKEEHSKFYFVIDKEDKQRGEDRLPVAMLESFCRANPMKFAILNACRSDQGVEYNKEAEINEYKYKYASMAHALIQTGVPCVVGMSHPISKAGATLFTRRLYRTMVDRKESISKAVRLARLELFAHTDDLLPSDWLTLILYSRSTQASMFTFQNELDRGDTI